uniref:Uncharacterized protein n=1 Tax=viral metagenome TaxID=1070528 RepID=A0A6C0D1D1_9ZZZZ
MKTKHFKTYPLDTSSEPWGKVQPATMTERRELLSTCGSSCFLDAKNLKFPVCDKVNKENKDTKTMVKTMVKTGECRYNERAIKRAVPSRAGEWKYERVKKQDEKLEKKLGIE